MSWMWFSGIAIVQFGLLGWAAVLVRRRGDGVRAIGGGRGMTLSWVWLVAAGAFAGSCVTLLLVVLFLRGLTHFAM